MSGQRRLWNAGWDDGKQREAQAVRANPYKIITGKSLKVKFMQTTNWKRIKKVANSFVPRLIFMLSLRKMYQRNHWKNQKFGDSHGYDKYTQDRPQAPHLLKEVEDRAKKSETILDLGCNCGYYLQALKRLGFTRLTGVDISKQAIEYGQKEFDLQGVDLHVGSFEVVLRGFVKQKKQFDLIFSMGATIELVHPSFDIVKYLGLLSSKYVVLFISEWGHATPRLYEYEFQRHGFLLVKCIRPYDGSLIQDSDIEPITSLLVFQKLP
jgi:2-polyprenyl-3-methyl-5-hydroxy-6-metoxy-1,4-benzoquinol methylase